MSTKPFRWGGGDDGKPRLPATLHTNRKINQWIRFERDRSVSILSGKVEIGQGILTALAQIAAEELDVSVARIRMQQATTGTSPDEAVTSGSLSIMESGTAIRHVCAEVRAIALAAAAAEFNVEVDTLSVRDGEIVSRDGRVRTHYWSILDEDLLDREATGSVAPKSPAQHTVVGQSMSRLDLPDKVFGHARFVHDMVLPNMLFGRVVRSSAPVATLLSVDEAPVRAIPGVVEIVRDGSFLGVLAESEPVAVVASEKLAALTRWDEPNVLPDENDLAGFLTTAKSEEHIVVEKKPDGPLVGVTSHSARYLKPYLAHASIAPSCAVARWSGDQVEVWSHSQGIYNLRGDLSVVLGMPVERIIVKHVEGAGCYGHNGADDVALDAVLLARAAQGRPVRLQWSREDELTSSPFGSAHLAEMSAQLDAKGNIVQWRHTIWANGYSGRPGRSDNPTLLAATQLAKPFPRVLSINPPISSGGGSDRNSIPLYDFPDLLVRNHRLLEMPLRTSAMRALGGTANVFAIESFMDELAHRAGADPVEFRLRHLSDPRGRAVIEAAIRRADWWRAPKREGFGRGLAFARYKNTSAWCAVAAEIEAAEVIRVKRLVIGVDVGQVINPDGVINQVEGGAVQTVSWVLKEAVRFDRTRITSRSWEDYPILRFSEVPEIEVEIVSRPDQPSVGAGEATQGPIAAAIGNAVFDALGVRVRQLPITPDQIVKAAA
jgi:nicotinate dehydrogenase subunit B